MVAFVFLIPTVFVKLVPQYYPKIIAKVSTGGFVGGLLKAIAFITFAHNIKNINVHYKSLEIT